MHVCQLWLPVALQPTSRCLASVNMLTFTCKTSVIDGVDHPVCRHAHILYISFDRQACVIRRLRALVFSAYWLACESSVVEMETSSGHHNILFFLSRNKSGKAQHGISNNGVRWKIRKDLPRFTLPFPGNGAKIVVDANYVQSNVTISARFNCSLSLKVFLGYHIHKERTNFA